eukprot:m.242756 g.242756  ORF g.242756 m.242756 type:complete len:71 (+) comp54447_c0_seq1:145-357(+)
MVVGIWNIEGTTFDSRQNGFGQLFISAGERVQARMRMTSFDSSVMEIKSDDMLKFITALQQALGRDYTVA